MSGLGFGLVDTHFWRVDVYIERVHTFLGKVDTHFGTAALRGLTEALQCCYAFCEVLHAPFRERVHAHFGKFDAHSDSVRDCSCACTLEGLTRILGGMRLPLGWFTCISKS